MSPSQAATARDRLKVSGFSSAATYATAVMGPTPGMVMSMRQVASPCQHLAHAFAPTPQLSGTSGTWSSSSKARSALTKDP